MPGSTIQLPPHPILMDTPRITQSKFEKERKDESSEESYEKEDSGVSHLKKQLNIGSAPQFSDFGEFLETNFDNDIYSHKPMENVIETDYPTPNFSLTKLFNRYADSEEEEEETKEETIPILNNETTEKQRYITLIPPHMLIITKKEIKSYKTWLKEIIKAPESEYMVDVPTIRLSIFLQFYRMNYLLEEITPQNFGSVIDWRNKNRRLVSNASLVHIPLDKNYSSLWWCTPKPLPSCIQDYGYTFICHIKQTHSLPYLMVCCFSSLCPSLESNFITEQERKDKGR